MLRISQCSIILVMFLVSGCAPNISPDSYAVGSVGQVNRVVRGIIISARSVDISGTSGVGTATGFAAGAAGGAALGGDPAGMALGAIGGAIVGGVAGAMTEEALTSQMGMEYIVETERGALMTVVQGSDNPLSVGQKVLVVYGTRSRIIPDPKDAQ